MEKDKIIYMTGSQIDKLYPIDKKLLAKLKAEQEAGIEPFFDNEHPDIDVYHSKISIKGGFLSKFFNNIFNFFSFKSTAAH